METLILHLAQDPASLTNNSIPKREPTRRKIALVVALAALVILSLFFATAGNVFVSGKTPMWVYHTSGTINSISISENGSHIAVGVGFNLNTGAVLLFDGGGNLLWERQTSRIIGGVSISGNGSHIEANGYQILPGPAGVYANAEVYAFDSNGNMLWNRTASAPWSATMSADGSRIAVVGSNSLALLTWQGQVVWNYTEGGYPTGNNSVSGGPSHLLRVAERNPRAGRRERDNKARFWPGQYLGQRWAQSNPGELDRCHAQRNSDRGRQLHLGQPTVRYSC